MSAQSGQLYIDAGIGHARPPAEVQVEPSTYGLLGGRFMLGPVFGSFYGALATDPDVANWVGGTLGAVVQPITTRCFGFALSGFVAAFRLGDPTPYEAVTARLIPEFRVGISSAALILRGYGGLGRSQVTDFSGETPTEVSSDLWAYGGGLELNLPLGIARAWTGAEAYGAASGNFAAVLVGAGGTLSRARWTAEFKLWETPIDEKLEVVLAVGIPLGSGWSIDLAGGQSGPDPLLGSPAGIDASAIVSWNALSSDVREPTAVYSLSDSDAATVLFRLAHDGAQEVSVIGDFSAWEPIRMERTGDYWLLEIDVAPGVYHFGFIVDGEWHVPEHSPGRVTDEYGRENATLVVPER